MRQILANIPAIGAFRVNLHNESETVIKFFGDKELTRLEKIDHLGAASVAFSGISHKRYEYVLLQCAIAQLVAKLYKDNDYLALASKVEIAGVVNKISSGEELLKSWILLSNIGHPCWTFATERSLLAGALEFGKLKDWLISGAIESDLKDWAENVIESYNEHQARYLITLLRIRVEKPHDPRKRLFRQIIKNRVLETDKLDFTNPESARKLSRLRDLSRNIQLLSMVALDSHYSHSPIRLELLPAIQELAESSMGGARKERFLNVIRSTAGWLADEVYLHPRAVAAQKSCEIMSTRKAVRRFRNSWSFSNGQKQFLADVMDHGFCKPDSKYLEPLVRLTFPLSSQRLMTTPNKLNRNIRVTEEIGVNNQSIACVDDNHYSKTTFLDVFYKPKKIKKHEFGNTYARLINWLIKSIEADALESVRNVLPQGSRTSDSVEKTRSRILHRLLSYNEQHLMRICISVIKNVIPQGYSVVITDSTNQTQNPPISWKLADSKETQFSDSPSKIGEALGTASGINNKCRVHELEVLNNVFNKTKNNLVVCIYSPICIVDEHGKKADEWDGLILDSGENNLNLKIIEAKSGGGKKSRANDAFKQLSETRSILTARFKFKTSRKRLHGLGAILDVSLWKRSDTTN